MALPSVFFTFARMFAPARHENLINRNTRQLNRGGLVHPKKTKQSQKITKMQYEDTSQQAELCPKKLLL
jgi:hypothetical protein